MVEGKVSKEVTLVNSLGLHARAAAKFMQVASKFDAVVTVEKNDQTACAVSILDLMMLTANQGDKIIIRASGTEAKIALIALVNLVNNGFEEDISQ